MIEKCEFCGKDGHNIRHCNDTSLLRKLHCFIELNDLGDDIFRDDLRDFVRHTPTLARAFVKRFCNNVPAELSMRVCRKLIYNHVNLLWAWKAKEKGCNPFDKSNRGNLMHIETFEDELLEELKNAMNGVPGAKVPTHPCDESRTYYFHPKLMEYTQVVTRAYVVPCRAEENVECKVCDNNVSRLDCVRLGCGDIVCAKCVKNKIEESLFYLFTNGYIKAMDECYTCPVCNDDNSLCSLEFASVKHAEMFEKLCYVCHLIV